MKGFAWVLMMCAAAAPCWAGRPLSTEDAYGVAARGLEVEVGFDYVSVDEAGQEYGPCFVGTYGVLDTLNVAAEVPVVIISPEEGDGESGIGDVALRAKIMAFGDEEAGPALAFVPEAKLATGDDEKGLGSGTTDVGALAAFSFATGPLALHANVGYAYAIPDEGDGEGAANVAAAAEFAAFGPVSLAAEFLAELASEETSPGNEEYPMAAGGGVSVGVLENLAVDAGVSVGLGAADGETAVTAGLTWGVL
ncbi:MAG: transporter [Candidatus Zixiibacteriota bacterium]|jgi:hypothetical protein